MKSKFIYIFIALNACAPQGGKPSERAQKAFSQVEYGTGKLLEGTGNLIKAGVGSAKSGWRTEGETSQRLKADRDKEQKETSSIRE